MKRSERRKLWRKIAKITPYVFLSLFAILLFQWCWKNEMLVRHFAISQGRVIKVVRDQKGAGGRITYVFTVNGTEYENTRGYPGFISSELYRFNGRSFPVAYDTLDINNSLMLIIKKNFEYFNLPFPDSLRWVEDYTQY